MGYGTMKIPFFSKKKKEEKKLDYKVVHPPNIGWLQKGLCKEEIDHLWKCIDDKGKNIKGTLVGNMSASYQFVDKDNWFWSNTIAPLCQSYEKEFANLGDMIPTSSSHPYYLQNIWVNYQKKHEFNPSHNHSGVYSFVIWMKIPTIFSEQRKNPIAVDSNSQVISNFVFTYQNILGQSDSMYIYPMSPAMEGCMVFFPSKLQHQVYPFFDCDETRISISGNVFMDTSRKL